MEGESQFPPSEPIQTARAKSEWGLELLMALLASAFLIGLLVLTTLNAGPLWRDETNSINVAQMPSLKELWNHMPFESFPGLWLLLLRGWSYIGLGGSDGGIRLLGLFISLFGLSSIWLCARWMGGRAPTLCLALIGSLPVFLFTMTSNRAYGLAICLLFLTFGALWRMVQYPSKYTVALALISSTLFLHCVYYDALFLCAMLFATALVALRRRNWKMILLLLGIGFVSASSMAVYVPIIRRGSVYVPMGQVPFGFSLLWARFGEAVRSWSFGESSAGNSPETWIWIALLVLAVIVSAYKQFPAHEGASEVASGGDPHGNTADSPAQVDLLLFCATAMVCGITAYAAFLLKLKLPTEPWYYLEMLALCAICLDRVLCSTSPALRRFALLRVGFLVVAFVWGGRSLWDEAHTRRSNLDLVAAVLEQRAQKGDVIIVATAWEGITFARYYHGASQWLTIPPLASHEVHRVDLMLAELNKPEPMLPVLDAISDTLQKGNRVWMVGHFALQRRASLQSIPSPPGLPTRWWLGPYFAHWTDQVDAYLTETAVNIHVLDLNVSTPVSIYENLPLTEFDGFKPATGNPCGNQASLHKPESDRTR